MLSKRSDKTYILSTYVNGIGVSFQADPRGHVENMVIFLEAVLDNLEAYK